MSNPLFTRLYLTFGKNIPDNEPMAFSDATSVGNLYGATSVAYSLAKTYFSGPNAYDATMLLERVDQGQRPHIIGGNIFSKPLSVLQQIKGNISITFRNMLYCGQLDLSHAKGLPDIAVKLEKALNSHLPVQATTSGDTITAQTINFTGYVSYQDIVDQSGPPLVIGGLIEPFTPNAAFDNQVILDHGSGIYTTFAITNMGNTPVEALQETYGILHVGSVTSGQVKAGFQVIGPGVLPGTALIQDLGGGNWLVNNAQNISGDFSIVAPSLKTNSKQVVGVTTNNNFLEVQPAGEFGYNALPSNISFPAGSPADALGLTQATGALDSTPGGIHPSTSKMLDGFLAEATAAGYGFTSMQVTEPRNPSLFASWATLNSEKLIPLYHTTTPAGE